MRLNLALFLVIFSNNLLGMNLNSPENFIEVKEVHKARLIAFTESDTTTIENNIKEMIVFLAKKPFQEDQIIQEPLNKALATLVMLWDHRIEKSGLELVRIFMEAGADPKAPCIFTEKYSWGVPDTSNKEILPCERSGETSFRSTVLDQATGNLKVYVNVFSTKRSK